MKRSISFILAFCMFFALTSISFATEGNKFKINEYEYLKELQNKSVGELKELNFTGEEIEEIRTLDFKKELEKRKDYDEHTLEMMGYSSEDIKALKSFSGTEEEMFALAGSITGDAEIVYYHYDSSDRMTRAVFNFYFEWEKPPVVQHKDIIGAMWSDGYLVHPSTEIRLNYRYLADGKMSTVYKSPKFESISAISNTFNVEEGTNVATRVLKSGSLLLNLEYKGKNENVAALFKYGHSVLAVNPSLSLGSSISFTFKPDRGINTELEFYRSRTL